MCRRIYTFCRESDCPNKVQDKTIRWTAWCDSIKNPRHAIEGLRPLNLQPGYCGQLERETIQRLDERFRGTHLRCALHEAQEKAREQDREAAQETQRAQEHTIRRNLGYTGKGRPVEKSRREHKEKRDSENLKRMLDRRK
jgi:hypothetical protein